MTFSVKCCAATDGDFSSLSVPLIFTPGSADGAEMCVSVTASFDDLVEAEEHFAVTLALVTPAGTGLSLGNTKTVVTITNSDGMCMCDLASL